MEEIITVNQAEMLSAINSSEVDMQIKTAKSFPRNEKESIKKIAELATMDEETAQECFYVLRRNGAGGQSTIEGVSVRMAELIAAYWGNIRVQTRIIGNDGKTITAQGVCYDIQNNVAVSVEVKRRITDRQGRTFSEDMQVVTGNAACAIAYRNAVLKVVPKACIKNVLTEIKKVAMGQALDTETSRKRAIETFRKLGVTEEQMCAYLEVDHVDNIGKEQIFTLRGLLNAIKDGTTTIADTFMKAEADRKSITEANETEKTVKEMVAKAVKGDKQ